MAKQIIKTRELSIVVKDENVIISPTYILKEQVKALKLEENKEQGNKKWKKSPPRNGPCTCGSGKKYKKCCYYSVIQ